MEHSAWYSVRNMVLTYLLKPCKECVLTFSNMFEGVELTKVGI